VRSLYIRIVLASLVTVIVSLAVFMAIAGQVMRRTARPLFTGAYSIQLEQAIESYRSGGRQGLASFIARLDAALRMEHHLVDAAGKDLVTGADMSRMLHVDPTRPDAPQQIDGQFVAVRQSPDRSYRLIIAAVPPFTMATFLPFYLLVLVTVLFLSWLAAVGIASPLRILTATVDRFGQGDLAARVPVRGKNEIARLGTSFNQMADRLRALLTAERQLLQDVSHELRSPLARLNFAIELARTATDRNAAVDRVQKEVDRLSALVSELVEMTRVEGDPAARTVDSLALDGLIQEVVDACASDAEARGCQVLIRTASSRRVRGDRVLLGRAFENVVRNAIRFSPPGAVVDVCMEEHDADTGVVIRDRGPGVPQATLPNLFDAFYRVDQSRDVATGGLGLGLAIAYRAIQVHHGSIRAENDNPGLRVTVTLPHAVKA
jgi:signal transduction histidine kinase